MDNEDGMESNPSDEECCLSDERVDQHQQRSPCSGFEEEDPTSGGISALYMQGTACSESREKSNRRASTLRGLKEMQRGGSMQSILLDKSSQSLLHGLNSSTTRCSRSTTGTTVRMQAPDKMQYALRESPTVFCSPPTGPGSYSNEAVARRIYLIRRAELVEAAKSNNLEVLRNAYNSACRDDQFFHVETKHVQRLAQKIERLEKLASAREAIAMAVGTGNNVQDLRDVIFAGEVAGLRPMELKPARDKLESLLGSRGEATWRQEAWKSPAGVRGGRQHHAERFAAKPLQGAAGTAQQKAAWAADLAWNRFLMEQGIADAAPPPRVQQSDLKVSCMDAVDSHSFHGLAATPSTDSLLSRAVVSENGRIAPGESTWDEGEVKALASFKGFYYGLGRAPLPCTDNLCAAAAYAASPTGQLKSYGPRRRSSGSEHGIAARGKADHALNSMQQVLHQLSANTETRWQLTIAKQPVNDVREDEEGGRQQPNEEAKGGTTRESVSEGEHGDVDEAGPMVQEDDFKQEEDTHHEEKEGVDESKASHEHSTQSIEEEDYKQEEDNEQHREEREMLDEASAPCEESTQPIDEEDQKEEDDEHREREMLDETIAPYEDPTLPIVEDEYKQDGGEHDEVREGFDEVKVPHENEQPEEDDHDEEKEGIDQTNMLREEGDGQQPDEDVEEKNGKPEEKVEDEGRAQGDNSENS